MTLRLLALGAVLLAWAPAPARALEGGAEAKAGAAKREAAARRETLLSRKREFDARLKAERLEFYRAQRAERAAFKESLAGRPAEERPKALAEFGAAQKERLKAFRQEQRRRRRAFVESLGRGADGRRAGLDD